MEKNLKKKLSKIIVVLLAVIVNGCNFEEGNRGIAGYYTMYSSENDNNIICKGVCIAADSTWTACGAYIKGIEIEGEKYMGECNYYFEGIINSNGELVIKRGLNLLDEKIENKDSVFVAFDGKELVGRGMRLKKDATSMAKLPQIAGYYTMGITSRFSLWENADYPKSIDYVCEGDVLVCDVYIYPNMTWAAKCIRDRGIGKDLNLDDFDNKKYYKYRGIVDNQCNLIITGGDVWQGIGYEKWQDLTGTDFGRIDGYEEITGNNKLKVGNHSIEKKDNGVEKRQEFDDIMKIPDKIYTNNKDGQWDGSYAETTYSGYDCWIYVKGDKWKAKEIMCEMDLSKNYFYYNGRIVDNLFVVDEMNVGNYDGHDIDLYSRPLESLHPLDMFCPRFTEDGKLVYPVKGTPHGDCYGHKKVKFLNFENAKWYDNVKIEED